MLVGCLDPFGDDLEIQVPSQTNDSQDDGITLRIHCRHERLIDFSGYRLESGGDNLGKNSQYRSRRYSAFTPSFRNCAIVCSVVATSLMARLSVSSIVTDSGSTRLSSSASLTWLIKSG